SGGGAFTAETMVPTFGNQYPGGALLLCGAAPPRTDLNFAPSELFKQKYSTHFETTANELAQLVPRITQARDRYQQLLGTQERASYRSLGTGGHCEFTTKSQAKI